MPNNPRQAIKRDLEAAIKHLDWIGTILTRTKAHYIGVADDYIPRYDVSIKMTLELQELLTAIKDAT